MRGKVDISAAGDVTGGITPAYAGKSAGMCLIIFASIGSPPPMRGKASKYVPADQPSGITPAYAGKRPVLQDSKNDMEDHPRLCGEKNK